MSALVPVSDLLTSPAKVAALVSAMGAVFPLVEVRPETRGLAAAGLQAQASIDKIAVDLEVAPLLEIDSADSLKEAQEMAGRLAAVCADNGILDNERKALTAPFFDVKKAIDEGYRQPREFIQAVLQGINTKVMVYHSELLAIEAKRQREEQAKRDKEAADIRAKQAEAIEKAQALVDEAAKAATPEAQQALLQQASEVADTGRAQAQQSTIALTRVEFAPVGGGGGKAKGVRETWEMEIEDSDKFFIALGKALEAGDRSMAHLATIDQSAGNKQANLQKEAFNVPGLRAKQKQSVSNRKAAI